MFRAAASTQNSRVDLSLDVMSVHPTSYVFRGYILVIPAYYVIKTVLGFARKNPVDDRYYRKAEQIHIPVSEVEIRNHEIRALVHRLLDTFLS